MTTLYCGLCGGRFEPDDDHVRINAERRRMRDRNTVDEFVLHTDCWDRLSAGWEDPV